MSVQTQWCHWCHVMNDLTFRDPEVLAFAAHDPQRHVHSVAPAATHYPYPGEAVAYLCTEDSCSLPLNDPTQLAAALEQ